jgi:phosphatidylserine/phosphatidylglycerophosphate/cardiolipin synthase-like enzyme
MIATALLVLFAAETPALDVFDAQAPAGRFPVRESQTALLTNGEASFAARIRALEGAKKSVRVQALIFTGDESGLYVSDVLKKKKAAGLDVRVIVDATSNLAWETQWMYFDLKQHGIEVEGYEAMYLGFLGEEVTKKDPLRANKRYHDKMWVIDAETADGVAIVGGLNIANEYFRVDPTPLRRWRDQDVILRGPIVEDVARCFDDNYEYLKGIKAKLPAAINPDNSWKLTRSVLGKIKKIKVPTWAKPELVEKVKTAASEAVLPANLRTAKLRFIQSRPRHGETFIEDTYLAMIARAKKTIHISNAYFIPSKVFRQALIDAAGRGVKVTIITNSPETNDIAQIAVVSRALYASLLAREGIEIHEWIGPSLGEGTLHAKLAIFDGVEAIVGSYNLDPRSARLNSETIVAMRSAELAGELEKIFLEQDLTKAKKVTLEEAQKYARPKKLDEIFKLLFSMSLKEWL